MTIQENTLPNIPEGKWIRCNKCKNIIYIDDLNSNYNVCINCGFHFNIGVKTRINHIFDENSFVYMFEKIRSIISEQLSIDDVDTITLDTSLTEDLEADSLDAVEVIMALEDEFGIEIPDEEAEHFKTIGDICKFIENNK